MTTVGETASADERSEYGEIAIRCLDVLAKWERLRDNMGWFIRNSLDLTGRREEVWKGDDASLRLFLGLSADLPGDRSEFAAVFKRAKSARDQIAHGGSVRAATECGVAGLNYRYYQSDGKRLSMDGGRSRLDGPQLSKRLIDLDWMLLQVGWAQQQAGVHPGPLQIQESIREAPHALPLHKR